MSWSRDEIERHDIWMFGEKHVLVLYGETSPDGVHGLLERGREITPRHIALHWTGANNSGRDTVKGWNKRVTDWALYHAGKLTEEPKDKASANYIVELPQRAYEMRRKTILPLGGRDAAQMATSRAGDSVQAYSDIVQALEPNRSTKHVADMNDIAIGIEVTNTGHALEFAAKEMGWKKGENLDQNQVIEAKARAVRGADERVDAKPVRYQAVQEEQYAGLILLLRYLCSRFHIRRHFIGHTLLDQFRKWDKWDGPKKLRRNGPLRRFRGIISHANAGKLCGAVSFARNRIYRGITDEWWPPLQLDGKERPYYMGPFEIRPAISSSEFARDFVRWDERGGSKLIAEVLSEIGKEDPERPGTHPGLVAFHDTESYFHAEDLEDYYAAIDTESGKGTFPIGRREVWHGGIHLRPRPENPKVYAAASGLIVAARVEDSAPWRRHGTTRFVLIRHCVFTEQAEGTERLKYRDGTAWTEPTFVHTLYMHLEPFPRTDGEHSENPPWLNYYFRHGGDGPGEAVFRPEVPVMVGDWLGSVNGEGVLHFEVLSNVELKAEPWDDEGRADEDRLRFLGSKLEGDPGSTDRTDDLLCEDENLTKYLAKLGIKVEDGIDPAEVARASAGDERNLRHAKLWMRSEWALDDESGPDALQPVVERWEPLALSETVLSTKAAEFLWKEWKPYTWVKEFELLCRDMEQEKNHYKKLFDSVGGVWHYHPITFLAYVNRLVALENGREFEGGDLEAEASYDFPEDLDVEGPDEGEIGYEGHDDED